MGGIVRKAIPYCAEDFVPVLQHAPDIVEQWLEGCTEVTTDFQHRIFSAGRAYITLCEALLAHAPIQGAQLCRTLCAPMIKQYIGGVENLLYMVFRVPDSPTVTALRNELAGLEHCHTDQALFNLAIAVSCTTVRTIGSPLSLSKIEYRNSLGDGNAPQSSRDSP